eukprot:2147359-Pyramimonas_sp.AAC.1
MGAVARKIAISQAARQKLCTSSGHGAMRTRRMRAGQRFYRVSSMGQATCQQRNSCFCHG